jgi:uncharacterized protein YdbL (DUF1318 family)
LVSSIDRLTRSHGTLSAIRERGVHVHSLSRRERTERDQDEAITWSHSLMTERKIAAAEGQQRARLAGKKFGDPTGGRLRKQRADARAQRAMRQIREARAAGATSYRELAAQLNARGYPAPGGKQWHAATIGRVLKRIRE